MHTAKHRKQTLKRYAKKHGKKHRGTRKSGGNNSVFKTMSPTQLKAYGLSNTQIGHIKYPKPNNNSKKRTEVAYNALRKSLKYQKDAAAAAAKRFNNEASRLGIASNAFINKPLTTPPSSDANQSSSSDANQSSSSAANNSSSSAVNNAKRALKASIAEAKNAKNSLQKAIEAGESISM